MRIADLKRSAGIVNRGTAGTQLLQIETCSGIDRAHPIQVQLERHQLVFERMAARLLQALEVRRHEPPLEGHAISPHRLYDGNPRH